jgi:putative membrane protein
MVYLYTFLSGQAILNPFENAKYDTPITSITRTIEINLLEQLGEKDVSEPVEPVDGEYLM